MSMIGQESPGVTRGLSLRQENGKPVNEIIPIRIIVKDSPTLYTPDHDMVQYPRRVRSG